MQNSCLRNYAGDWHLAINWDMHCESVLSKIGNKWVQFKSRSPELLSLHAGADTSFVINQISSLELFYARGWRWNTHWSIFFMWSLSVLGQFSLRSSKNVIRLKTVLLFSSQVVVFSFWWRCSRMTFLVLLQSNSGGCRMRARWFVLSCRLCGGNSGVTPSDLVCERTWIS